LKLNKVHHVAIISSDYEKAKNFYVNILGLEIIKETYREARNSYKLDLAVNGDYQIELFSFENPPKRLSYPEASGLRHLSFEVDNIDAAVKELNEKGINAEPVRIDEVTGKRFTFFSDPDGLPLEIYEK
jgi:glyoxylase I family protein